MPDESAPRRSYTFTDPASGRRMTVIGTRMPTPEEQVALFARERATRIPDPTTLEDPVTRAAASAPMTHTFDPGLNDAIEAIPATTAMAGGYFGGPLAIPAAGVAGAGGEVIRHGIQRARGVEPEKSWGQIGTDAGRVGKEMATLEGLGKVIQMGAKGLYRTALDAPASVLERSRKSDLAKRGLEERILATRGGRERAGRLLEESGEESRKIAAAADAQQVPPVSATEVQQGLDKPFTEVMTQWTPDRDLKALAEVEEEFAERTQPFSMAELEEKVRKGGARASEAYAAAGKLGGSPGIADKADMALTDEARRLLYERVPEIIPEKQRAAELIGIINTLKNRKEGMAPGLLDATLGGTGAGIGALLGGFGGAALGAPLAVAAGRTARSPAVRSGVAIGLNEGAPWMVNALRYRMMLDALGRDTPPE